MSDRPESNDDAGLSRRDFMQGRFWRAIRFAPAATGDHPSDISSAGSSRPSLVMRYPKSLGEVAAGDPQDQIAAAPLSESMARRRTIPLFRPPGAIDEQKFLAGCTRCDECREACPHNAIIHAPARLREAAGTPMLDADHQACLMCEDFPCIAACQPQVLSREVAVMMGTAQVTAHLCLAHHGTTCTVCSERCPVPGAIEVVDGKPTIREATCTGCGVCRYVCPAPENAILLMPAFLRPSPAEPRSHE